MPSKYWPSSGYLSSDSSASSDSEESDVARDTSAADEEIQGEASATRDQNIETVARQIPIGMRLPELSPQQRAGIFYLSLIEGRCRTQAANTINAGRRSEDCLPEDHPEVCDLAEHLFAEMTPDLVRAGMFPEELTRYSVSQLRQYLRSFDALLSNLATNHNNFASQQYSHSGMPGSTGFFLQTESSASFNPETALIRQEPTMSRVNAGGRVISSESDILSFFNGGGTTASLHLDSIAQSYENIKKLGKGGFGTVFEARHRLDRGIYAIKKVKISAREFQKLYRAGKLESLISEVASLARLDHPHIVRYMHCWVETSLGTVKNELSEGIGSISLSDGDNMNTTQRETQNQPGTKFVSLSLHAQLDDELKHQRETSFKYMTDMGPEILFGDDEASTSNSGPATTEPPARNSGGGLATTEALARSGSSDADIEEIPNSAKQIDRIAPPIFNFDAYLYIKMKLYPMTLNDFIGKPTEESVIKNFQSTVKSTAKSSKVKPKHCFHPRQTLLMLKAITKGVMYLHRRSIVHRDLKPENIFISILPADEEPTTGYFAVGDCLECFPNPTTQTAITHICPCIGDFGLVHVLGTDGPADDQDDNGPWPSAFVETSSSGRVGTQPYMPQKMPTTEPFICPKLDVFSLGIIAVELSTRFATGGERARFIDNIKQRNYPADFDENPFAAGIKAMVQEDRDLRWGMEEVRQWLETLKL